MFFRHNATALNRLEYGVNITFICTGKPKKSCDLLYCDIRLIAVAWNQTQNISELYLYYYFLAKLFQHVALRSCDSCVMSTFLNLFSSIALLCGTKRRSRLLLYFPSPDPGISHFHKKPNIRFF